jgi:hypothetical protein
MTTNYFLFGLGFYTGVALCRRHTFKGSTLCGIARGVVIGILLWPLAIPLVYYAMNSESKDLHEKD